MKPPVESYIVRLYRESPDGFSGVVEDPRTWKQIYFNRLEDLGRILELNEQDAEEQIEKRRAVRLGLEIPALVSGTDIAGAAFKEKVSLINLSSTGAFFLMERRVKKGAELEILLEPERSRLQITARIIRIEKIKTHIGVGVSFRPDTR